MVAPLTAYAKSINRNWPNGRSKFNLAASGFRQKPPFINTAYSATISYSDTPDRAWGNNTYTDSVRDVSMQIAINSARAELVGKLGDTSSFGATLTAERKQSYGMIKSGIITIFASARALRKGDVVKAAQLLGVASPERTVKTIRRTRKGTGKRVTSKRVVLVLPSGKQVSKSLANKWLWWSYGVKPLAGDIYNAVDVLQRDIPYTRISGSGAGSSSNRYSGSTFVHEDNSAKSFVKMSANVRVKNPNLYLANQLGLTNPAQWLLEGIPFSFVIDWFSNLSQVVSQMTDFVGLEIKDPLTASKTEQVRVQTGKPGQAKYYERTHRHTLTRALTIPPAKLRFAYERFSWQRGANAISLLVGFLRK